MRFKIEKPVLELFPHVTIGIVSGMVEKERPDFKEILTELRHEASSRLQNLGVDTTNLMTDPRIAAWRKAYQQFGVKAKRHNPTHEALARRLLKGQEWPTINPIVDLYLTNQAAHLLPHGGYDADTIIGGLRLDVSKGGERFEPLGGGEEVTDPGEIVYRDNVRILTRRWNYRDCEVTKIADNTKRFILMIESPSDEIPGEAVEAAAGELVERYNRCFEGTFQHTLLRASWDTDCFEV